jgi:hypothetical protein
MINQLKKIDEIEVIQENASKIVQYDTCAISKMHRLIQRKSSAKAIKNFSDFALRFNHLQQSI